MATVLDSELFVQVIGGEDFKLPGVIFDVADGSSSIEQPTDLAGYTDKDGAAGKLTFMVSGRNTDAQLANDLPTQEFSVSFGQVSPATSPPQYAVTLFADRNSTWRMQLANWKGLRFELWGFSPAGAWTPILRFKGGLVRSKQLQPPGFS